MILDQSHLAQLIALSRADAPRETCGIIGGKDGRAFQVYPLANIDDQPTVRYLGDPSQQLKALQEIDSHGWDVIAIFHSHPKTEAYPSDTDIQRAFYPDATFIIVSLMNPHQAHVRGFTIKEGKVGEVTLEVEDKNYEPSRTNRGRAARRTGRPRAGRVVATLSDRRSQSRVIRGTRR